MADYQLARLPKEKDGTERIAVVSVKKKEVLAEVRLRIEDYGVSIYSIWVMEELRRQGLGTALLQAVVELVAGMDYVIPLECSFIWNEDTENLRAFFEAQANFDVIESAAIYRLSAKRRKENENWKKLAKRESKAKEFFALSRKQRNDFMDKLKAADMDLFVEDESVYEKELCFADVKDDEIRGAIFFKGDDKQKLELSFLYTGEENPATLQSILCAAIQRIDEKYAEHEIWLNAVNLRSRALADQIFGESAECSPCLRAVWNEWTLDEMGNVQQIAEEA